MKKPKLIPYIIGFIASIVLTIVAYDFVINHLFSYRTLVFTIIALALIQVVVQLFFFLHLDQEKKPHWNLNMFMATVGMILILVIGSLVIMNNLNYHHLSSQEQTNYIIKDEGIYK